MLDDTDIILLAAMLAGIALFIGLLTADIIGLLLTDDLTGALWTIDRIGALLTADLAILTGARIALILGATLLTCALLTFGIALLTADLTGALLTGALLTAGLAKLPIIGALRTEDIDALWLILPLWAAARLAQGLQGLLAAVGLAKGLLILFLKSISFHLILLLYLDSQVSFINFSYIFSSWSQSGSSAYSYSCCF